jgi:3',5'-cyclic AMP phosphodiesterase CpdA
MMRRIVHLSDLHFGRVDETVLPSLARTIQAARPDVVVVSGDLTQRARSHEFRAARDFLATLAFPQVIVPGNHDVPLYNVYMRAFHPLRRFRRFFGEQHAPFHADGEVAVVGINTARSLTFKDGRINREQVADVCRRLLPLGEQVTRVAVTHHPFHGSDARPGDGLVGRATMAMAGFSRCRIDLVLSGHLHSGQSTLSGQHYAQADYSALLVQAGTATSIRRRGEPNSFNMVLIDRPRVTVERWSWDEKSIGFARSAEERFVKIGGAWKAEPSPETPP